MAFFRTAPFFRIHTKRHSHDKKTYQQNSHVAPFAKKLEYAVKKQRYFIT
jgi:hypothetical protein